MNTHKDKRSVGEVTQPLRHTLSEELTRRLLGLSYLEGRKDPNVVLGELFDRDADVRRLTEHPENVAKIVGFVEKAIQRNWTIPNLVHAVTRLWNSGFFKIEPESAERVISFVEDLHRRKWDIATFVEYATKHYNAVDFQGQYMRGEITLDELEEKLGRV
jgi:hypothetical protein